jgi:cytochrome oxidase Cu insertion factor (SCO1/SenC/PrrC family)/thiol-disulfide isomerase/thioredoxin
VLRLLPLAFLAVMAGAVAVDAAVTLHGAGSGGPGVAATAAAAPATGIALDKPLPRLPLVDAQGRPTSLGAFRGRYVVLAPSLTLCREVCPLTTAALESVAAAVRARGMGRRVVVAEASVDPWRDSPARLRAFKRRTGTRLTLLTGSHRQLRRLWRVLGVRFEATRGDEGFDVSHTDGVFIIDPRGHLRIFAGGMPGVGTVRPRLAALLSAEGRRNAKRPESPWTVADLLGDLWQLMSVPAPAAEAVASSGPPAAPLAGLQADGGRLLDGGAPALRRRLAALRGHPVVINAWASWCPPCRAELPLFAAAAERHGNAVAFLGLDVSDNGSRARAFLAAHPLPYPSYAADDGAAAATLGGFQGLPTTVFVDRRGKVAYAHTGAYRDLAALEADLALHALD